MIDLRIVGGLLVSAAFAGLLAVFGLDVPMVIVAAVTLLCALWWMSETLPLGATALLPLAIFPLFGVLTPDQVAQAYGNPLILLFLGGFLLSRGMEVSGAHRHIALGLMQVIGTSERRLVFGFLAVAALLSMWLSNTATALMLLPVALAVTAQMRSARNRAAVLLAVAYGASIGGLGTPIGSPPNLLYLRILEETTGSAPGFVGWMSMSLPVVALMLPAAGLWLARHGDPGVRLELPDADAWTSWQRRALAVFALTALAWVTRTAPFGGWQQVFDLPEANDASVALIGALLLFALPNGQGGRLLDWEQAKSIPWGMLLLFGGGIAIAKGFSQSGLSVLIAGSLAGLASWPLLLVILSVCLLVTFLTEINSNTATAALLLPILAAAAVGAGIEPWVLMLPAALSASCAFMLPVATPPNAIVFGSGQLPMAVMWREGLILNLLGAIIISGLIYLRA